MQVMIRVNGDPDFYPDHLDIEAPPPIGATVEIDGKEFAVLDLRLISRISMGGSGKRRNYYAVDLITKC